jgi:hypothetical protein
VSTAASSAGYAYSLDDATVTGSYGAQASSFDLASGVGSTPAACASKPLKGWTFALGSLSISVVVGSGGGGGGGGGTHDGGACGPIATTWDSAVGTNGHAWYVIVPAEFPACASHPTGSITSTTQTTLCGTFFVEGELADSGAYQSSNEGSFPTTLWGIDSGLTPDVAQQLQTACMPFGSTFTYSGDATYEGI